MRDLGQATVNGMTTVAYQAYRRAADMLSLEQPGCGLRWELLAAIGKTESNHGAGRLDAFGNSSVSIVGIPIGPDSDGGLLDGDATRDHAVGPMQFIPSTWKRWGTDANGDGQADPGNVVDAAHRGRPLPLRGGRRPHADDRGRGHPRHPRLQPEPGLPAGGRGPVRGLGQRPGPRLVQLGRPARRASPAAGLASNGGPDGRAAPGDVPLPAPPPTTLDEVKVFTATGLAAPNPDPPPPEVPGACVGPSLVLGGRAGFLRCGPADTAAGTPPLDPCEPAPYDATLVGCLPDPTAPAVLIRLAAPVAVQALGPPPPYRLLVLDGGDRCAPIPVSARRSSPRRRPRRRPRPSPSPARHRATTTSAPATTPPTTGATARHKQAGAAATTSRTADTTTTTTADPSTTPTTEGPTTTAGTTGPGSTAPGTTGPDTTVATPPTVPAAERSDLRLHQRGDGHRPPGHLLRHVVRAGPPGRSGRPPAHRRHGLQLSALAAQIANQSVTSVPRLPSTRSRTTPRATPSAWKRPRSSVPVLTAARPSTRSTATVAGTAGAI